MILLRAIAGAVAAATLGLAGNGFAQSEAILAVREYRAQHEREIVGQLVDFLSLPNVASDVPAMYRNAEALVEMLERRGASARILETGGPPHVFGELPVPGATRTILFYCHFDGQPVDLSRWRGHHPFTPIFRTAAIEANGEIVELPASGPLDPEWRVYARSASDDKSPIIALMVALDALRASGLSPNVNLKFLFEGDEEMGSPTLERTARENRDLLSADLVVAADGPSSPTGLPTLNFGARGIITLELTVYGPLRPVHSGHYGNWAPNPAMRLAQLLASMKDPETGHARVSGFYDDVVPLSDFERAALAKAPNDDEERMRVYAIPSTEAQGTRLELINLPSLNVRGLRSGWVGSEARTIVPDAAIASIDLRLVKNVQPQEQAQRVIQHIKRQGYHVISEEASPELRMQHPKLARVVVSEQGYPAFRTSMDLPISRTLIDAIESNTSSSTVRLPTTGGSVPLYIFTDVLETPTVIAPTVNHDNNQHSPNENLRLGNLWSGIETLAAMMLIR